MVDPTNLDVTFVIWCGVLGKVNGATLVLSVLK